MFYFILEFVFLACLWIVVFLFLKKLPLVDGFEGIVIDRSKRIFPRSEFIRKIDQAVLSFLEKTLRKLKLSLMKLDNFVSSHLSSIRKKTSDNGSNGQNLINEMEDKENKESGENPEPEQIGEDQEKPGL